MRGIERSNTPHVSDLSPSKVDRNYGKHEPVVARNVQCFFESIGLALDTVDQHTERIFGVKSAHFEDVAGWIVITLAWIGRWENLVARTTNGLKLLYPA